ncbi:MAG: tetratricopeptide repeat protein [Tepidisphaeraceae bacterium]
MKIILSSCSLLCGYALLAGLANAQDASSSGHAASTEHSRLQAGYEQVIRDLHYHWWDPNYAIPRIRPTRGGNSTAKSFDVGTIDNAAAFPSFWQMEEYANIQYWNWKITHSSVTKAEIWSEWGYISHTFSDRALSSADKSFCIINVSDDAAWALNYLVQVYEVTRDQRALVDAVALLPSILNRFADPNTSRVRYGSLLASPYGILYATKSDDPDHQGSSTTYEIMIADSALYLYQQTHNADYLNYAIGTYDWTKKYMKHSTRGYYYCELDIRPTVNGTKNPHYLVPMGDYYGSPVRGLSSSYSGGTMAMAVAAARLYKITGQEKYLAEARQITSDYVRRDAFLRPGNLFVNERDGWTDGFWAPAFADEVLTLPGVDSNGLWKTALCNTALSIISQRTPDGFYGADWSGPELNTNDRSMTWAEQATRCTGSGAGMALPAQIMTSSNSAAMVSAAELVDARSYPVAKSMMGQQQSLPASDANVPSAAASPPAAPSEPQRLLSRAKLLIQNNSSSPARDCLQQIIDKYPQDPAAEQARQMLEHIGN